MPGLEQFNAIKDDFLALGQIGTRLMQLANFPHLRGGLGSLALDSESDTESVLRSFEVRLNRQCTAQFGYGGGDVILLPKGNGQIAESPWIIWHETDSLPKFE